MGTGIELSWATLGIIIAGVVLVNFLTLAAFALVLRTRLRSEHIALEERMQKQLQGKIEAIRKRCVTLDEHSRRRGQTLDATIRKKVEILIKKIDTVNGRSTEELKEILESVCVLSSILASLDLRQARRIDILETRFSAMSSKPNE